MAKYTVLFSVSGQTDIEANSPDEALDFMHKHYKGVGANCTKTQIVAIDGKYITQERRN